MGLPGYNKLFSIDGTKIPAQRMSRAFPMETVDDTNIVTSGGWQTFVAGLLDGRYNFSGHVGPRAGYLTTLKIDGTPVSTSAEATTNVSGKIYRITDTAKRIIDETVTGESTLAYITVYDSGTPLDAEDIESIDTLTGTITLASAYSVSGAITADYDYIPVTAIAQYKGYELNMNGQVLDASDNPAAQSSSGRAVNDIGLISASARVTRLENVDYALYDKLVGRTTVLLEIKIGPDLLTLLGWFNIVTDDADGAVSALEENTVELQLAGRSGTNMSYLAGASLNAGIGALLAGFIARSDLATVYAPDGTNGWTGNTKASQLGFRGATRGVDEFSGQLVISGAVSKIP